ncbi:phosphate ABC transporter substrate-binding protein PstS [Microbacterium neimengense]
MRSRSWHTLVALAASVVVLGSMLPLSAQATTAAPISGSGSTAVQSLVDAWRRDLSVTSGQAVAYSGTGASAGRADFIRGSVDFAVSELPFQRQPEDGSAPELPDREFTYVPLIAGGTAVAYNLQIDGRRITDLRLSGATVAGVFAGDITRWNDAAIAADNPRLELPDQSITPVVRSDRSGSTAQFTAWMAAQYPQIWTHGATQLFPATLGWKSQSGSVGVTGYTSFSAGSITYVENAYAHGAGLPVADLRNAAGAYVAPDAANVQTALGAARTVDDPSSPDHLTQVLDDVYANPAPTAYPLSSYTYLIVPTRLGGTFTPERAAALRAFAAYAIGEGQAAAAGLGYAPLPAALVAAGRAQIARIPATQSPASEIGIEADVLSPHDTELSLEVPASTPAQLDAPQIVDGRSVSTGNLTTFAVVDGRALSRPGYTVHTTITDFSSGSAEIPAESMTVTPRLEPGSTAIGVVPAAAFAGSAASTVFASAPAGSGVGTAVLGAGLRLAAPQGSPGGTYRATMTFTVISR